MQFAGVVGNSGGEGMWLVHSAAAPGGLIAGGGGVALDARGRIFTGGGDHILTLNHDGKQLWQTPLPDKTWVVGGTVRRWRQISLLHRGQASQPMEGGYSILVSPFIMAEPNLCRVEMVPGAAGRSRCESRLVWFAKAGSVRKSR